MHRFPSRPALGLLGCALLLIGWLLWPEGGRVAPDPEPDAGTAALARRIDAVFAEVESAVTLAAGALSAPDGATTPIAEGELEAFGGALRFLPLPEADCVILSTGAKPLDEPLLAQLGRHRALAGALSAIDGMEHVSLAWTGTVDSTSLSCPVFDVVAYIPPGMDFSRELTQVRIGSPAERPSRAPFWMAPYVDLTGKGYVTTFVAPVDRAGGYEGVVGADLRILEISRRFLAPRPEPLVLLTGEGFIAGLSPEGASLLGLPPEQRHIYTEQVRARVPTPDSLRLDGQRRGDVRGLARLFDTDAPLVEVTVGGVVYLATIAPLPTAGWRLVRFARR